MTVEAINPIAIFTVSGVGPYGIGFSYDEGSLVVSAIKGSIRTTLDPDVFSVAPLFSNTSGNLFLSLDAATTYAGDHLIVERNTALEQGWAGTGARERGLESQLDRIIRGQQEMQRGLASAFRLDTPISPGVSVPGRSLVFTVDGFEPGPMASDIANAQANAAAAALALEDVQGIAAQFGDVAGAITAAETARDRSQDWAEKPEDVAVQPDEYSALHHATKASGQRILSEAAAISAGQDAAAASKIVAEIWTPRTMFLDGGAGFVMPTLDPIAGYVWQDAARVTPVTAAGQRVGAVQLWAYGGPIYAGQATTADKPYIGRQPAGGLRNRMLNSACTGGVPGTPGTIPTSWGASGAITIAGVVGTGLDVDGHEYIDMLVTSGGAGVGYIQLSQTTGVVAVVGEQNTFSMKCSVVGGALTNLTQLRQQIAWRAGAGGFINQVVGDTDFKGDPAHSVRSIGGLAPPTTEFGLPQIRFDFSGAISVVVRISAPQFEVGTARSGYQRVVYNTIGALDITEAGVVDAWYLYRSDASDALPVTVPDYGTNATVLAATNDASAVTQGQTIGAGPFELLGAIGSKATHVSVIARAVSGAESALFASWAQTRNAAAPTPPEEFSGNLEATSKFNVYQSGANYIVDIQHMAGQMGAFVTPRMFGGDPTGLIPADAAVQACWNSGYPVLIEGRYNITRTHVVPAGTWLDVWKPQINGFLANMANSRALDMSAANIYCPRLGVRSTLYPASGISNSANYDTTNRSIRLGNGARLGQVYCDNLCTALDVQGVSDARVDYLHVRDMRSKLGHGAAWHVKQSSNVQLGYLDAERCDRGFEVEYDCHNIRHGDYRLKSIYPSGYASPAAGYATYSFSGPSAHSHLGEGGCTNITFGDGVLEDCLSPLNFDLSTGYEFLSDSHQTIRIGHVHIISPRGVHQPVILQGIDVEVASIRFTGLPVGTLPSQMLLIGRPDGSYHSRDLRIGHLEVDDGAYQGGLIRANAPDITIGSMRVGAQAANNSAYGLVLGSSASGFDLKTANWRQARGHAALYHVEGSPFGIARTKTRYTLHPTEPAAATRSAAWIALSNKYEAGNFDT